MTVENALRDLVEDAVRTVLRKELQPILAEMRSHAAFQGGGEFLKVAEAADLARRSKSIIRSWIKAGRLRRYGDGRPWTVRRDDLLAVLQPRLEPVQRGDQDARDDEIEREATAMLSRRRQ